MSGEGSVSWVMLQSWTRWRFIYYLKVGLSPWCLYKSTSAIHAEPWHGLRRRCQPERLLWLPVGEEKPSVLPSLCQNNVQQMPSSALALKNRV